jgi:uncharacterized membrane protein
MAKDRDPLNDTLGFLVTPPHPDKKLTIMGFLRSRFLTGVLVSLPLVVTLFFGRFLFNLLDRWSYPISNRLFGFPVYGVGAALAIILVFALGMLAHNVLGRRMLRFGEKVIARVPVLRSVYLGTREMTRAFGGDRTKSFLRVALVPFPLPDVYAIAFITAEFEQMTAEGPKRMVTAFMPTTPNPTTGFFMLYPADQVRSTGLTVDEAARMVISGGILAPDPRKIMTAGPEVESPHRTTRR